jgi:hypothetical protein
MSLKNAVAVVLVGLLSLYPIAASTGAQTQEKQTVKIPEPGVPEIMTMQGRYVRAAYNNEGYVILGYEIANDSIGDEWLLLDCGVALMEKVPDYKLLREHVSLTTPDGTKLPLPTVEEYRQAHLQALNRRADVARDSINYFPPWVADIGRIGYFSEATSRAMPYDFIEISTRRGGMGRLYFKIPGGIQYGQHWLDVKFEKSLIRVPFRILTKEEAKYLDKNFKEISQQVKEAFQPKKK